MNKFKSLLLSLALCVGAIAVSGCQESSKSGSMGKYGAGQATPTTSAKPFTIIATTDMKDLEPLLPKMQKELGFPVKFRFGSTMGSVEDIVNGTDASAAMMANAKWLMTDPVGSKKVLKSEKIMISPIAIGVCESTAKRSGWINNDKITWKDLAKAAGNGSLKFAMSNPVSSNQGFMAVLGVATAVSGKGEALTIADVDPVSLSEFFKGYKGVGDNSTYLAGKFIEKNCVELNAFINYESWLLSLNSSGKLKEPMVLVYPKEGVATADFPLMLLNSAEADRYQKVVDWLKSDQTQTWLVAETKRRPINLAVQAEVSKQGVFKKQDFIELPFTPDRAVAAALMDIYLNSSRRPIASTFVVDISGSMAGNRLEALKSSLITLATPDGSLSSRMTVLTSREKVIVIPFSDQVYDPVRITVGSGTTKENDLWKYKDFIGSLSAGGGTALYPGILEGIRQAAAERKANRNASVSVVVFTDGVANKGINFPEFVAAWNALDEDSKNIPIYTILYGEGTQSELEKIAQMSGGKMFNAKNNKLYSVFKEIRAYQ